MAQCYRNSGSLKNGMAAQAHRTSGSFAPRLFIFDRLFDVAEYRTKFHYVDEEYDEVIRVNFRESNARQSDIRIDPTTVSHFMRGHRNNPTIKTICEIADGANLSVSDLLKTVQDKELDKRIKENDK